MRIFNFSLFLGAFTLCWLLDFLFIHETSYIVSELSAGLIAAIAGGSALVSGAANLIDSASTNKANKDINRENLDWQTKENEKSRLWSQREFDRQFEKVNTYNTPTAQRQRLQEAGYNPYMVNGQISGSNVASQGSTPSDGARGVPSSIPMQRSDYGFIGSAGRDAVGSYVNVKSVDANVANVSARTDSEIINNAQELYHLTGDKEKVTKYLNSALQANHGASYNLDSSPIIREFQARATKEEAQSRYESALADLKDMYGDKEVRAALRISSLSGDKLKEEMLSLAKDREKSDAEIAKLIADKIKSYAEANKINLDSKLLRATFDLVVESMRYDNQIKQSQSEIQSNEAGESNSRFVQRRQARMYQVSPEGQTDALHNQVTYDNSAINRLDRIKDAVNPLKMGSSK